MTFLNHLGGIHFQTSRPFQIWSPLWSECGKNRKERDLKCVMHMQEAWSFPNVPQEVKLINQFDVNWFFITFNFQFQKIPVQDPNSCCFSLSSMSKEIWFCDMFFGKWKGQCLLSGPNYGWGQWPGPLTSRGLELGRLLKPRMCVSSAQGVFILVIATLSFHVIWTLLHTAVCWH